MKRILYALAFATVIVGCNSKKGYDAIMPDDTPTKVTFNMSHEDFYALGLDSLFLMESGADFSMYYQNLNGSLLNGAIYYFGKKDKEPLYEIIFMYNSDAERDADALRLLGEKTSEEGWELEWEPYNIKAWTYESKLIIAARIPGTEWYEEE